MDRVSRILVLHADAHEHGMMGCAGHPDVKTPRLDQLAAEGTLFENAYACAGVCVPSRATLMTGQYPIAHGVTNNSLVMAPGERTLGRIFSEAGWDTGYFGKTHFGGNDQDMRAEGWRQSFLWHEQYNAYLAEHGIERRYPEKQDIKRPEMRYWSVGTSRIPPEHYFEKVVADKAIEFIRGRGKSPWVCFAGFVAPHGPFSPPPPYDRMYDPSRMTLPERRADELARRHPATRRWVEQNQKYLNEEELRIFLATICGLVSLVDTCAGRVLDALKEEGLYDDCLIIYTSDHGDFGGRHGVIGKSWSMEDCLMRTPLIVKDPRFGRGRRSEALVSNVDVLPSLLDAAGLEPEPQVQGVPWTPLLSGQARQTRDAVFAYEHAEYSGGSLRTSMIRKGGWKLVQPSEGEAEIYDLERDPGEFDNLAGQPEAEAAAVDLKDGLLRWHAGCSGRAFDRRTARFWEDETCFYDETRFTGTRLKKLGDSPV